MVHWPVSKTEGEDEDDSVDAAERPLSSGSSTKSALTPEEEEQAKDLNETRQRNKMKEPAWLWQPGVGALQRTTVTKPVSLHTQAVFAFAIVIAGTTRRHNARCARA